MTRYASRAALLALAALIGACAQTPKKPQAPAEETAGETAKAPQQPADKGDPEGRFTEALKLMRTGKTREAETAFAALAKDFPQYSGPYTNLGILQAKAQRRDQATGNLSRAEKANAENLVALNWLAHVYRESGQFERAESTWKRALAVDPGYAAAQLNLGLLYEQDLKRPTDAIAAYRAYYRASGEKELKALVWIAELEAAQAPPAPAVEDAR